MLNRPPQDTESSDADDTGADDAVIASDSGSAGQAADGFLLPREQIKHQNRRNNANNLNKIEYGKGGAGGLTASGRTREIFVFNLLGDTSDDDLQSFFCQNKCDGRWTGMSIKIWCPC